MARIVPQGWYDISLVLKQGMHNLILDPQKPKIYRLHQHELGSPVTITMLEILTHTGTHIDCPLHFIQGGSTVTDMALDATIGPARVIEIEDPVVITPEELQKHGINKGERILCKTLNSPAVYESKEWIEDYVYLGEEAARYLAEKEIRLFGMDAITVGNWRDDASIHATHRALLDAGIYIMEGCALADVPPGEYELLCLPLRILHGDASPVRAILRPLAK
ncbi:MAG: cyclase family protein [Thermoleophilia bacterium]|nr:cyclase family protein [Thermoleophilia bacterium]